MLHARGGVATERWDTDGIARDATGWDHCLRSALCITVIRVPCQAPTDGMAWSKKLKESAKKVTVGTTDRSAYNYVPVTPPSYQPPPPSPLHPDGALHVVCCMQTQESRGERAEVNAVGYDQLVHVAAVQEAFQVGVKTTPFALRRTAAITGRCVAHM